MLDKATVYPALPAIDLQRARNFWENTVGLEPAQVVPAGVWYLVGANSSFLLFPSSGAPSGTHTQVGFRVDDIEDTVTALRNKGVEFEDYDTPGLKTVNGIAEFGPDRGAFFRDSEGNVIAVIETAEAPPGIR